tara:strand:+ start:167 stop:403 length:237 start_codon:yes stop_codon:yes gene_type:complete
MYEIIHKKVLTIIFIYVLLNLNKHRVQKENQMKNHFYIILLDGMSFYEADSLQEAKKMVRKIEQEAFGAEIEIVKEQI